MSDELTIRSLYTALQVNPYDVPLRLHLAELLQSAGRLQDAVREAGFVLSQDPNNERARTVLGFVEPAAGVQHTPGPHSNVGPGAVALSPTSQQPSQSHRNALLVALGLALVGVVAAALVLVLNRSNTSSHQVSAAERAVQQWTAANNVDSVSGTNRVTCHASQTTKSSGGIGTYHWTDHITSSERVSQTEAIVFETATASPGPAGNGSDAYDGVHTHQLNAMTLDSGSWEYCFQTPFADLAMIANAIEDCSTRRTDGHQDASYPTALVQNGENISLPGCAHSDPKNITVVDSTATKVAYETEGSAYILCLQSSPDHWFNYHRATAHVALAETSACS